LIVEQPSQRDLIDPNSSSNDILSLISESSSNKIGETLNSVYSVFGIKYSVAIFFSIGVKGASSIFYVLELPLEICHQCPFGDKISS